MKTGTGIIPHIPGERQVDQATAGEPQRGNEHRATKTAMPQPFKMEKGVQAIKKQKTKTAQNRHAPMAAPTPEDFQQVIAGSPDGINA